MKRIELRGEERIRGSETPPAGYSEYCVNLRKDGGSFRSVSEWKKVMDWKQSDITPIYLHATPHREHLIGRSTLTGYLYIIGTREIGGEWKCRLDTYSTSSQSGEVRLWYFKEVKAISSIGNTLIVNDGSNMCYILWDEDNGIYRFLGTKVPNIDLCFSTKKIIPSDYTGKTTSRYQLYAGGSTDAEGTYIKATYDGSVILCDNEFVSPDVSSMNATTGDFDNGNSIEEVKNIITDEFNALHNALCESVYKNGDICQPVLFRAGIRLYDGSYAYVTPPFYPFDGCINGDERKDGNVMPTSYLVDTTLKENMWYFLNNLNYKDEEILNGRYKRGAALRMLAKKVYFKISQSTSDLEQWKDVISSIDIFMSSPVATIDSEKLIDGCHTDSSGMAFSNSEGKPSARYIPLPLDRVQFTKDPNAAEIADSHGVLTGINLPKIQFQKTGDVRKDICGNSVFYRIRKIDITDSGSFGAEVSLTDDIKDNYGILEQLPTLKDISIQSDFRSNLMYSYNNRMHYAQIHGYMPKTALIGSFSDSGSDAPHAKRYTLTSYAVVARKGKKVVSHKDSSSGYVNIRPLITYNEPEADSITIYIKYHDNLLSTDSSKKREFTLVPHTMLDMSYFMATDMRMPTLADWETWDGTLNDIEESNGGSDYLSNTIYVSQSGNPFSCIESNTITLPDVSVTAMQSTTTALSTGETGQSPLYIFTDGGIWASEVGGTMPYTYHKAISREIARKVCPTDHSITFVSDKGVMDIQGRTVKCLSEIMRGKGKVLPIEVGLDVQSTKDFVSETADSDIYYNYRYDELVIRTDRFCFVYDIRNGEWSRRTYPDKDMIFVRHYPNLFYVGADKSLVQSTPMIHKLIGTDFPQPDAVPEEVTRTLTMRMYDCAEEAGTRKDWIWIGKPIELNDGLPAKLISTILRCILYGSSRFSILIGSNPDKLTEVSKVKLTNVTQKTDIHFCRLPMSRRYVQISAQGSGECELNGIELIIDKALDTKHR